MSKSFPPPRKSKARPPLTDRQRCRWAATDPQLATYHDEEWGREITTDDGHLERMALEIFQCGLSWKIVLVKRAALREAFREFALERVAAMTGRDVQRLLGNADIIRNRKKIEATIHNAQRMIDLATQHGGYRKWLAAQPAATRSQHTALMKLLGTTFRFMGPETSKCYLWGVGKVVPPHDRRCWMRK